MAGFRIEWDFHELGLSDDELDLRFGDAARRWSNLITGFPKNDRGKPALKSLKIRVEMADLNAGRKKKDELTLGHTEVTESLPKGAGRAAGIPTRALMQLDSKQFRTAVEDRPEVVRDLIAHEVGHALGFGSCAPCTRLIEDRGRNRFFFIGRHAMKEYAAIGGKGAVPLESSGNSATAGKHWDENTRDKSRLGRIMVYELMSGNFDSGDNRLTRLTAAAMRDLGYEVDMDGADSYRDAD
jgi:hypothetical protein